MQKTEITKVLRIIAAGMLCGAPLTVSATTYGTLFSTIFDNGSNSAGIACTNCHDSSLVGAVARHSAPEDTDGAGPITGADFDVYELAAARVATMVNYTDPAAWSGDAYMPMDPNQADFTYIGVADLDATDRAAIADWQADGAPFAAPTSTTLAISGPNKTYVTLEGDVNTNTLNSPGTSDGEWYFEWGPGSTATYSNGQVGNTVRNLTSEITGTYTFPPNSLSCGSDYHYRAVAKNGDGTVAGSKVDFSTLACTDPVIGGVTLVADETSQSTNEDTDVSFNLTVTDDDPGSLQWSKTNGSKGTASFTSSSMTAFSGSATVLYSPSQDQTGPDSFTVTVNNMNTGTSHQITFNMNIIAINDQPAFNVTSVPSTSAIEDTQYSYQVVIDDPDDSFASGLTIGLSGAPFGMTANASTGEITWTPANGVMTSGLVTVSVDDGHEDGTVQITQQFTVAVTATNDPPVITPGATTTATEDVQYSYQMQVTDIDDTNNGTDITFTLSNEPAGMAVSNTGLITWTPLEGVLTSGPVTIEVEDGDEDNSSPGDTESFTISVTPVNDSPLVTPGAVTTANESDSYSYQLVVADPDDANNGTDLTFTPSNLPAGMTVSPTGLISWAVPRTGTDISHNNITVVVADGGEDGATSSSEIFNLAVSIVDGDSDGVADYDDNCPGIANSGQEDLDNDTVRILPQTDPNNYPPEGDVDATARDPANALAESYLRGGDACDEDADGDGMSNTFEDAYAFLDPLNASDAVADEDGDGVSNLDEFLASTAPDVDSVGPEVNAPADITVDASGLFTRVRLDKASGNDGNDGKSSIFKTAVNLSVDELAALDDPDTGCQAFSNLDTKIKPFRPGPHTVTWATCDSAGNSGRDSQQVNVRPLASVTSGQAAGEGQAVTVDVVLNGKAIASPATVNYTVTGTSGAGDHDAVSGTVTFNSAGTGVINFNTLDDAITESDETVVITLHTPVNVALGNVIVHTVTITEANIAPSAILNVTQPGAAQDINKSNTVYQSDGVARVEAMASDGNGDILSFDWSDTDAMVLANATITSNMIEFDPGALTAGMLYKLSMTVSDGALPVTVDKLLLVKLNETVVLLDTNDTDNDGIDDLAEGFADVDADGIPDYLDNVSTPPNAVENNTAKLENSVLIETDPGLHIALGETAVAAQTGGAAIGIQDIINFGGDGGVAVTNAGTTHTFLSSLLNFEISGLNEKIESVHVVIPLLSAIQAGSIYRKYNSSGWFDFVIDDKNEVHSAAGDDGTCPPPGSNLYTVGLTAGHMCLQLTIQDGGANDADRVRNFIVKDPGGLALIPEPETLPDDPAAKANGRVGALSLWFMVLALVTLTMRWRVRLLRTCGQRP